MDYFRIEPEAVEMGPDTVLNTRVTPPIVSRLHIELQSWRGSPLVGCFPAFAVTHPLGLAIVEAGLSGVRLAPIKMTVDEQFRFLLPKELPEFSWLQVFGWARQDDFAIDADQNLILSRRALDVIEAQPGPPPRRFPRQSSR